MYHANLQISTSISRFDNLSRTSLRRHPFSFPLLRFVAFFLASRSLHFLISTDLETRFDIFFLSNLLHSIFSTDNDENDVDKDKMVMDGPVSGIGNVTSALHRKTTNEKKKRKKNCRRKRKGKPNVPLGLYENDNCSLYKVSQNKNCVARKNTTKKSQTRLLHTEDGLYTEEESFPR